MVEDVESEMRRRVQLEVGAVPLVADTDGELSSRLTVPPANCAPKRAARESAPTARARPPWRTPGRSSRTGRSAASHGLDD
jgi:hypothetical protein